MPGTVKLQDLSPTLYGKSGEILKRRKEIYEAMYPETKHGGLPGLPGGGKAKDDIMSSFATDTANKTGYSSLTALEK